MECLKPPPPLSSIPTSASSSDCVPLTWIHHLHYSKKKRNLVNSSSNSASTSTLSVAHSKQNDNLFGITKLHFLEEKDQGLLSQRLINLSRSNKTRSVVELFASIHELGLRPNSHACNSLLSCLIRNGLVNDALKVFVVMREKELATCHTCSLVLKAVGSVQGCDSAVKLFDSLQGEGISCFDVVVYNTLIAVCGKAKNWVEVEKVWRKLKENELSGSMITYDLLVSTFVQCGQMELAIDAYDEMIDRGLEPSEDIMKAIVACCTKEGNWHLAVNVFEKMIAKGMNPNVIAYNAVINCLGKAGEDELAFRVYDKMKSLGILPDVYTWSALLGALYRSERYSDALQLFESINAEKGSQSNAHIYNVVLMACQRLSLWERSIQILWQMETSEMQMETVSYNHVIATCEATRKPKVALQIYQHMIQQKCDPDTFTYLSLIRACVWGSLWTEVENIMESVAPDASLYNALIHGFCLRGKITLAKELYAKMGSIGLIPDGKTRALMLQHLPNNGVQRHPRWLTTSTLLEATTGISLRKSTILDKLIPRTSTTLGKQILTEKNDLNPERLPHLRIHLMKKKDQFQIVL